MHGLIRFYTILFLLFSVVTFFGCANTAELHTLTGNISNDIFNSEIRFIAASDSGTQECGTVEIEFADAVYRSLKRNSAFKSLGISDKTSLIDIEQAESSIWPRAIIDLSLEVPIDSEVSEELVGGVFLRYDVLKAIYASDAVSVMEARRNQLVNKRLMAVKSAYSDLMDLLIEIDYKIHEASGLASVLQTSEKILGLLNTRASVSPKHYKEAGIWEINVKDNAVRHSEAEEGLSYLKKKLHYMLGIDLCSDIRIRDSAALFPKLDDYLSQELSSPDSLKTAWLQRNDVRIAETELFLAEMAIVEAKRKRLPHPALSLGLGNILLRSYDDTASVVPILGITVPFIDMGDISRQIRKASHERDMAKENLAAIAREMVMDFMNAASQADLSLKRLQDAEYKLSREEQQLGAKEKLYSMKRIDSLEMHTAGLAKARAEIEYHKAVLDFRSKVNKLIKVKGGPLQGQMELLTDTLNKDGTKNN